ncbi:MAG: hypothetical protein K2M89_00875 [Clostridiales bacterium]|nr:hypothetical protein [Clostridiales bacterium]
METVYILQVVTISITVLTLIVNVLITILTNRQKNYNEIITSSRIEFMKSNRDNAARFTAEAKNIAFLLKSGKSEINLKMLYKYFEYLCISLKVYNAIDNEIIDSGKRVIDLVEQSILGGNLQNELFDAIDKFSRLINIYDDADWKFIKQQFNSTNKNSADFDKICNDIKSKYNG